MSRFGVKWLGLRPLQIMPVLQPWNVTVCGKRPLCPRGEVSRVQMDHPGCRMSPGSKDRHLRKPEGRGVGDTKAMEDGDVSAEAETAVTLPPSEGPLPPPDAARGRKDPRPLAGAFGGRGALLVPGARTSGLPLGTGCLSFVLPS